MPRSATASPPCSPADLPRPPASCCRCSAGRPRPRPMAGGRKNGRLRRGHVFLVPGDSPVGYRLPLGSLPHVPKSTIPSSTPPIRPNRAARSARSGPGSAGRIAGGPSRGPGGCHFTASEAAQQRIEQEAGRTRRRRAHRARSSRATGGCACSCRRWRRSRIISSWSAGRSAAADLGLPVHIEGYGPPHDPRLNVIRVAPDPGVIEVNVHPATRLEGMRRDHRRRL
jgi:uncharacterized protein (DUF2126 family)